MGEAQDQTQAPVCKENSCLVRPAGSDVHRVGGQASRLVSTRVEQKSRPVCDGSISSHFDDDCSKLR